MNPFEYSCHVRQEYLRAIYVIDGVYEGIAEAGNNGEYCGETELVVNTNRMISQNRGMQ